MATLKNVTNGKRVIKSLLNEKEIGCPFDDKIIHDLMTFHPNGKVNAPEYFVIRISPMYKQRTLYFKNKDADEDSVSYISCIENLLGKYKREKKEELEIIKTFRNATFDDYRRNFFSENTIDNIGICSNPDCGQKCGQYLETKLHIDHCDKSFKSILDDFISSNNINLLSVSIYWDGMNPHLTDNNLQINWQKYHNENVKYRILCGPCNCSFGDKSTT